MMKMKTGKKLLAIILAILMAAGLAPRFRAETVYAAPDDDIPELFMSVANKIDVALAIGKTNVNFLTFERDLRAALKWAPRTDGLGPDSGGGSITMGNGSSVIMPDSDADANWRPNLWDHDNNPLSPPLTGKDPRPVPNEDLYILAAETVDTNVSKTFDWWVYDHTRPNLAAYGTQAVPAIIDDENHIYVPLTNETATYNAYVSDANNVIYSGGVKTSRNVQDTDPSVVIAATGYPSITAGPFTTYTPPASWYEPYINGDRDDSLLLRNPDAAAGNPLHPYQGNYRHMISSNGGSQMDFYGYGLQGYKDLRYLPNEDNSTIKTFEFAIAEDMAFDALDGVGFFFNTTITGNYSNNTQFMTGYLLFLRYASGIGNQMVLYKFKDVNVKTFHETWCASATDTLTELAALGHFTQVATATYSSADYSRRIKVEAAPDSLTVYYVGNPWKASGLDPRPGQTPADTAAADAVLTTPLNVKDAAGNIDPSLGTVVAPLKWTITDANGSEDPLNGNIKQSGAGHEYVCLDMTKTADVPNYVRSYGYGPMASYISHGCGRPTHVTLRELSMTTVKIKPLADVVKMPQWHENTIKYLVNLNESIIEDFDDKNNAAAAALLSALTNDDIYYLGWGKTINAVASADFLNKNDLKGIVVDMDRFDLLEGNGFQSTDPSNLSTYSPDGTGNADWLALSQDMKDIYSHYIKEAYDPDSVTAYWKQIYTLANEIYARYYNEDAATRALTTDQINVSLSDPAKMTPPYSPSYPNGEWMITHDSPDEKQIEMRGAGTFFIPDPNNPGQTKQITLTSPVYMINKVGDYALDGVHLDSLSTSFTFPNPGHYNFIYRDNGTDPVGQIDIHRAPVAAFSIIRDPLEPTKPKIISTSYDPDVYDPAHTLNEGYNGIVSEVWTWLDMDGLSTGGDTNTHTVDASNPFPELIEGHTYVIKLTVTDDWGVSTTHSANLRYSASALSITPPIPRFTMTPTDILKGMGSQTITITDQSSDPQGLPFTYEWTILKNDQPFASGIGINNTDFVYNATGSARTKSFDLSGLNLDPGTYQVRLATRNHFWVDSSDVPVPEGTPGAIDKGISSNGYYAMSFKIIEDKTAPRASIAPAPKNGGAYDPDFQGNGSVTLSFVEVKGSTSTEYPLDHMAQDEQISGFDRARIAVTQSAAFPSSQYAPASGSNDPAWGAMDTAASKRTTISMTDSYVHWEAWDKAGNYRSGTFGPYTVVKAPITMTLIAEPATTNNDDAQIIYGNPNNNGILLTAALNPDDFVDDGGDPPVEIIPTGRVDFYQWDNEAGGGIGDWVFLGSDSTISFDGTATWTGAIKTAIPKFQARYSGDGVYNHAGDDIDDVDITTAYVTIWIEGVDGDSGSVLYRIPKSVLKNEAAYQVVKSADAQDLKPQYKLDRGPQGPQATDNGKFAPMGGETVTFTYLSNAVTVTVYMKDYDTGLNILTPIVAPATLGHPFSYVSPSIPGYTLVDTMGAEATPYTEAIANVGTSDNIEFLYKKIQEPEQGEYMLTIICRDEDTGAELGRAYLTANEGNDQTINAPILDNYTLSSVNSPYYWDATGNDEVTFTYTRDTTTLTLEAYDQETGSAILDVGLTNVTYDITDLRVLENYNFNGDISALTALVMAADPGYVLLSPDSTIAYITIGINSVKVYYAKPDAPVPGTIPVEVHFAKNGMTYDAGNPATYELKLAYVIAAEVGEVVTMSALVAPTYPGMSLNVSSSTLTAEEGTAEKIIFVFERNQHTVTVLTKLVDDSGNPISALPQTALYTVAHGENVTVYVPGTGYEAYYYTTSEDGHYLQYNIVGGSSFTLTNVTGNIEVLFVYKSAEDVANETPETITIIGMTDEATPRQLYKVTYKVSFPYILNTTSSLSLVAAAIPLEYGGWELISTELAGLPFTIEKQSDYEYTFIYTTNALPADDAPVSVNVYDIDTDELLLSYNIPAKVGTTVSVAPSGIETLFANYSHVSDPSEVLSVVAGDPEDITVYMTYNFVTVTIYFKEYDGVFNDRDLYNPIEMTGKRLGSTVSYEAMDVTGYELVDENGTPLLTPYEEILSSVSKTNNTITFYYNQIAVANNADDVEVDICYKDWDENILGYGKAIVSKSSNFDGTTAVMIIPPAEIGEFTLDPGTIFFEIYWDSLENKLLDQYFNELDPPEVTYYYDFVINPPEEAILTLTAFNFDTGLPIMNPSLGAVQVQFDVYQLEMLTNYLYTGDIAGLTDLVHEVDRKYGAVTRGGSIYLEFDDNEVIVYYKIDPANNFFKVTFRESGTGGLRNPLISPTVVTIPSGSGLIATQIPGIIPKTGYSVVDGWKSSVDGIVYGSEELVSMMINRDITFTAQCSKKDDDTRYPQQINDSNSTPIGLDNNYTSTAAPTPMPMSPDVSEIVIEKLETINHIRYISGYPDNTVRPNNPITRAEVAAIFFRLLRDEAKNTFILGSFSDISAEAWYAQAINYLAKIGVLTGYEDGTFRPNQNITRAEFAVIASHFDHQNETRSNPFSDLIEKHWAYRSILSAYDKGWMEGYTDGTFKQEQAITRAEAITVVNKILGRKLSKRDVPEELLTLYNDLETDFWAFSNIIEASAAHNYHRRSDWFEVWTTWNH